MLTILACYLKDHFIKKEEGGPGDNFRIVSEIKDILKILNMLWEPMHVYSYSTDHTLK